MLEIHEHTRLEMGRAQLRYQEQADRHRHPAPKFQIRDKVWLDARNISTTPPFRKLNYRQLGPFEIIQIISPQAYKLALLRDIKIHPVQSVSLLELGYEDPYPGQIELPPPPVIVEGVEECVVEEILDARIRYKRLEYLIKWIGDDNPEWWLAKEVNKLEAIDKFHARYPNKPPPLPEDD
jgi:hypothetical protein